MTVIYEDPEAIGANPSAVIYPNGMIVGTSGDVKYIRYPCGWVYYPISNSSIPPEWEDNIDAPWRIREGEK